MLIKKLQGTAGLLLLSLTLSPSIFAQSLGYFRQPAISTDAIVFVAEGDLWKVPLTGGSAQRLTSHVGEELTPAISADGKSVAYSGRFEGSAEIYTMPLSGGVPKQLTFDGGTRAKVAGYTPTGDVLYSTNRYSGFPQQRLYTLNPTNGARTAIPLAEAAEGCYLNNTLIFARQELISDNIKRYKGGGAQQIWAFSSNGVEAQHLTKGVETTNRQPMCAQGRVYFLSDRDGTMNVWSMTATGTDLRQHTKLKDFDIRAASASTNHIALQIAGEIWLLTLADNTLKKVPISLQSDFMQLRPRWLKNPLDYLTDVALSPNGEKVALNARGQLFSTPVEAGRRVEITRDSAIRLRNVAYAPDGKTIFAFADTSGEFELWQFPANGADKAAARQLTFGANVLRTGFAISPDGKTIVHTDKQRRLYATDVSPKQPTTRELLRESIAEVEHITFSPDSKWIAFTAATANYFSQINLLNLETRQRIKVTSNRYASQSAAFSPDGQFLYFLSDRNLQSLVSSPWGQRNPMPYFDKQSRIYAVALNKTARWPFAQKNELQTKPAEPAAPATPTVPADKRPEAKPEIKATQIDEDGLFTRLYEVPIAPANYSALNVDAKRLYVLTADTALEPKRHLRTIAIEAVGANPPVVEAFLDDVRSYEISGNGKKVLLRRANDFWVVDAAPKAPAELAKSALNLKDWTFTLDPRAEWQQTFTDAWRMHRDYFWDVNMHGADWQAVRQKYAPFIAKLTDRAELGDVLAQMASEAAALHSQVGNPDIRKSNDEIDTAGLAATLTPTSAGVRVDAFFSGDPELLEERSPLATPDAGIAVGDLIIAVNGVGVDMNNRIEALLRNQAGKQVLLQVRRTNAVGAANEFSTIVVPVTAQRDFQLRYLSWERERDARVQRAVNPTFKNRLAYVHLQAMGGNDIARWSREFHPAFQKEGLILDLRYNGGGSIDSWIISQLQRRAWLYWQSRDAEDIRANQQLAFTGHVVALIDANTYSDGETMAEALKRLGVATVIGKRTAGAGIWLSDRNRLVDNGIVRAAELGTFVSTPTENKWVVEGIGVTPDLEVDNPPHATFNGEDAQLTAAIKYLEDKITQQPLWKPVVPAKPERAK
jgi:tricorn protease